MIKTRTEPSQVFYNTYLKEISFLRENLVARETRGLFGMRNKKNSVRMLYTNKVTDCVPSSASFYDGIFSVTRQCTPLQAHLLEFNFRYRRV